jgi:hypothetical protein
MQDSRRAGSTAHDEAEAGREYTSTRKPIYQLKTLDSSDSTLAAERSRL